MNFFSRSPLSRTISLPLPRQLRVAALLGLAAALQTAAITLSAQTATSTKTSTAKSTSSKSSVTRTSTAVKSSTKKSSTKASAKSSTKASAKSTKARASKSGAAAQDTAKKPARKVGALGSGSGERHLSFRDAGSDLDSLWPPKMPAPLPGSILPNKRIIAFYGNPLSKRMGILGEFETDDMLRRLDQEVAQWNKLDPSHPVQPALHLISIVAQADAGRDGKYRLRMDSALIEKVYGWAKRKNAILFLDVQVGLSTLQQELPWLERFLKRPDVHLGIDPEFSMKNGGKPGKKIGTYDASDVNYASSFLADLVDKYNLPPKILVVHRFTKNGVTNTDKIKLDPKVQIVMHMDGFGAPWLKRDSFYSYIKKEPVQFVGWKQFTKSRNDNPATTRESILRLWPVPLYIQLQ